MELTRDELLKIKESLSYTRKAIDECQYYPTYEFKKQQISEVDELIGKISEAINGKRTS